MKVGTLLVVSGAALFLRAGFRGQITMEWFFICAALIAAGVYFFNRDSDWLE